MFRSMIAGVVACAGLAATASAQPAATFGRPNGGITPVRYQEPGGQPPAAQPGGIAGAPSTLPGTLTPRPATAMPGAPAATFAMPAPPAVPGAPTYTDGNCATCAIESAACESLCGPPGRVWVSAEWLYWKTSGMNMPVTATSGPVGAPRATAGALGAAGTTVLFGGNTTNGDFRNGFRVNAGFWLDPFQRFGIQASFFNLSPSRQGVGVGSNGSQVITRPFFNVNENRQDTQLVSTPNVLAGTTITDAKSNVSGFAPNFLMNLCCNPCGRFDLTLGYQYFSLIDDVAISENLTSLPGANIPAGSQFVINDNFHTVNTFHGPTIGFQWEKRWSHWYVNAHGGVALGVMNSTTTITGSTAIVSNGAASNFPGGLLTQPTNIGSYSSRKFAAIPQGGVRLGCQVTERMRAFVGYDFMYVSNVQRAGDQIDTRVNTTQLAPTRSLVGIPAPAYTPKTTDFWMHGISIGAEFRF